MANENWEQERKILDALKPVYDALFSVEERLTPKFRQMVYGVRIELGLVEHQLRREVRHVQRDGSSMWAALRSKEEK